MMPSFFASETISKDIDASLLNIRREELLKLKRIS
jgi:hypothetical protein